MIHLDTSFLIRMLDRGSAEARFLEATDPDEAVVVSTIAWAEFLCGPIEAPERELAQQIVAAIATCRSNTRGSPLVSSTSASGRRQRSLSDCLIAAAAIHDGARLATANLADFRRFASAGLKLV